MVELVLKGIGFKAFVLNGLFLQLGYSHYIKIDIHKIKAKKQKILLPDKIYLNLIQSQKFPDPYKATGIQVKSKIYKLKQGKKR